MDKFSHAGPEFPKLLAASLFGDLSSPIHTFTTIDPDLASIPYNLGKAERHLLVAIAAWMHFKFEYVDEDGIDVTEEVEPGITSIFSNMSPPTSTHSSNESIDKS